MVGVNDHLYEPAKHHLLRTYRREDVMSKKVWLITGAAGRGMGADFAKAALAAGHAVAATGRNSDAVSRALGTQATSRS